MKRIEELMVKQIETTNSLMNMMATLINHLGEENQLSNTSESSKGKLNFKPQKVEPTIYTSVRTTKDIDWNPKQVENTR